MPKSRFGIFDHEPLVCTVSRGLAPPSKPPVSSLPLHAFGNRAAHDVLRMVLENRAPSFRAPLSRLIAVAALLASAESSAQGLRQTTPQSGPRTTPDVAALTRESTPMPIPEDLLRPREGGLTADQVGRRAMATSFAAKQSLDTMRAAEARVGSAWAAFLPRLSASARYTRLSNFTVPSLTGNQGSLVGTEIGVPAGSNTPVAIPAGTQLFAVPNISVPLILDTYLVQATITVPVSDYLLRIDQAYTAATRSAEAARYDVGAARAGAFTNGRVLYYAWLQARGAVVVSVQTLEQQRVHLSDAGNLFAIGRVTRADVLRAETEVATAEVALVQAENAADLAETQMRIALHLPAGQRLVVGEGLDAVPGPFPGELQSLFREATRQRFELKSARANSASARKTSEANKAGRYPVVSAFADAVEGNPNPRYFPAAPVWSPTWDVGVQATWSPNDVLTANGAANDYEARADALDAQAQLVLEGIEVEVTQDFQALRAAEVSLELTRRELASANEAYRVAHGLFNDGRGTSTTLTDAERDLTAARIDALTALVNVRIARVRLEHAVGRDLRAIGVTP